MTPDDPPDAAPESDTAEARERDHARRNALQADLIRHACERLQHRAHVEAALKDADRYEPATNHGAPRKESPRNE